MYMTFVYLFTILLVSFTIYYIYKYFSIDLYNTVYFGPFEEQVIVIAKTLFTVTVSYMDKTPLTISMLEWIKNYREFI